ncbi:MULTISPECIES: M48 family metalloprotease [Actibacterium]|uniref:Putative Zn-dependent protease n=1 Tax=Actibacterium naphthalenivorans TaxID=1614693 RepID=A0A840C7B7_9RHOB|nr:MULTISPECIES: M48 family metalloprotease [Actibacterium]ALG89409.1 peptidase M48 [Actibacterium sp. EMB200-NS6]MBB4020970.1 putative Zn-dependent protease [Actibacterium naphthalenivorans]
MRLFLPLIFLALSACVTTTTPSTPTAPPVARLAPDVAARNFISVVERVEPVAESECRARTAGTNCDFQIVVDRRGDQPANAYQSLDARGRPVITFTLALIADAQNPDELAFIMGHEAGHHIEGHIPKQQQTSLVGALLLGAGATLSGADQAGVDSAQRLGATLGSRVFSKDMELDADGLGTVIAHKAGYDPVLGARYFTRIPDPGDRFLGSHPPNSQRQQKVAQVAATL